MALSKKQMANPSPLEKEERKAAPPETDGQARAKERWWLHWEIYLIAGVALLLRLLFINTTQFMADHAIFYQMAYDGVAHHLWPISGNRASTGPFIPPLFVYLIMIPAAISSNPVAGAIFVALWNVAGVLITYLFTHRYYGRLAGTLAALLYATEITVIIFNRDIWQPDLLPPLAVLFMWCLFRGAVEQRRYWFLPATLLLAAMCQLHTSAVYLVVPLCATLLLSFKTVRVRELVLTGGALLLFYSPFLLLEKFDDFADIKLLAQLARLPATLNTESLQLYSLFMRSTVYKPWGVNSRQIADTHLFQANDHSIMLTTPLRFLQAFLQVENSCMPYLLICAFLTGVFLVLRPTGTDRNCAGAFVYWKNFLASPERKGLLLLLLWQTNVLLMMRTSIDLFIHYLLFFAPGQFILLAVFFVKGPQLAGHVPPSWRRAARLGVIALSGLIIAAQFIGSLGTLIDRAQGNFDSRSVAPEYFDLASLQRILDTADQLARQRHLARIYMPTDLPTTLAVRYLAQFEKTPIVTFDDTQCVILPPAQTGPVVFIVPPYSAGVEAVLHNYADETFAGAVDHPGGAPFRLFIATARPEPAPVWQFIGGWQGLSAQAQVLADATTAGRWLMTRWRVPVTRLPAPRTSYTYSLNMQARNLNANVDCPATAEYAGDQIFLLLDLRPGGQPPQTMSVQPSVSVTGPQTYRAGPITFVTFDNVIVSQTRLQTIDGAWRLVLHIAPAG